MSFGHRLAPQTRRKDCRRAKLEFAVCGPGRTSGRAHCDEGRHTRGGAVKSGRQISIKDEHSV